MVRTRRIAHATCVLTCMIAAAGCGADRAAAPSDQRRSAEASRIAELASIPGLIEAAQAPRPEPAGLRAATESDSLATAYAPVSDRINFLITAETMRTHDVAANVDAQVLNQRFGAVQVEAGRMRRVLRAARSNVDAVAVREGASRRVRSHLLAAIDSRMSALDQLDQLLALLRRPAVDPGRVDAQRDRWRAAWDESLDHARTATTIVQGIRARAGMEPAPEEAFR